MVSQSVFSTLSPLLLALATGGALIVLGALAAARPVLCRLGLRNATRRRAQALLLVCGLAVSTAVITASFGLTDSFVDSAQTQRLARLGNIDESVTGPFTRGQVAAALARIRHAREVQAATALTFIPQGPTITSLRTGLSVHDVDTYAVPPDFDAVYGPLHAVTGRSVRFSDLRPGEAFVSPTLAQAFDVRPGDTLRIAWGTTILRSTVRAVLATDLGTSPAEAIDPQVPQVVLPLARLQQAFPGAPNTIVIKNVGRGGMDDVGQGGRRSRAVIHLLQHLFPGAPASLSAPHALGQTDFGSVMIHPLKPDVVEEQSTLQVDKLVFLSAAGQQFSWLPPVFSLILVGAGMLLVTLLMILLITERRAELGMSRAIGMRRHQLIQLVLFEGCAYSAVAAFLGVPLGVGATAVELLALTHVPALAPGQALGNAVPLAVVAPEHPWVRGQSVLSAWCLGVLTGLAVVLLTALWISRTPIVAAMRDLDEPAARTGPFQAWRSLWTPPLAAGGVPVRETRAGRLSRRAGALVSLVWALWVRGPLCLATGGALLLLGDGLEQAWLGTVAEALLVAGVGLLIGWVVSTVAYPSSVGRRVGVSLIGLGWLALGLHVETVFLALFQPVVSFTGAPSATSILLGLLLPLGGILVVALANADLLVALISGMVRRLPHLASISRVGLVYPLTYRLRTGVTVALLSLVTFLVLLLVTINLGSIQEAQAGRSTGGFQLQATVFGSQLLRYGDLRARLRALQTHHLLRDDFTAVGLLRLMYDFPSRGTEMPILLDRAGQPLYRLNQPPQVADDHFLSTTILPLYARARGFSSDQQVWTAVRDQPGDVVLQYDASVQGLPSSDGFGPFTALIPNRADFPARYRRVTVIGLVPGGTPWRALLSVRTATHIVRPPDILFLNTYLFRLRAGVNESRAAHDLSQTLQSARRGIALQSLDHSSLNAITAALTLFLSADLAIGLLFGALAIGVIASRAVVERRQQIGMLRALGLSRGSVLRAFLLEYGFVVALGLAVGTALALWIAVRIERSSYQDLALPLGPIVLILAGGFLAAIVSTVLPARRAAGLPPAEALRYE